MTLQVLHDAPADASPCKDVLPCTTMDTPHRIPFLTRALTFP